MVFVLIGVVVLLVVVALWFVGMYNRLVRLRNMCEEAWAGIDVQLTRRHDLIPNLVETVKGYASHERGTLEEVVQARNSAVAAQSPGEMAQAEGALTGALGRLFALAESYPDLKANENFKELQDELSLIEDKLAAARRFYNAAVQDYNTAREQFPNSIVVGMFNFPEREFFDLGGERTELSTVPEVKF